MNAPEQAHHSHSSSLCACQHQLYHCTLGRFSSNSRDYDTRTSFGTYHGRRPMWERV